MAKRKVRLHPDVLAELLKSRNMTEEELTDTSDRGVDRKTWAKVMRGEEITAKTRQKLANKLKVPPTYFDPPAAETSVPQSDGKPEDSPWLNLMLRKIDAESLSEMLSSIGGHINWLLNVHAIDDETVQLLEQLEDAVNELQAYHWVAPVDGQGNESLRAKLAGLKMSNDISNLLEELAKRGLAILGAEYLAWRSEQKFECHEETEYKIISYVSGRCIALSVEAHPGHPRRARVWQGKEPPKSSPGRYTIIEVNGVALHEDIPF